MSQYVPQIYAHLTRPVQIDLGSTAQTVDNIDTAVRQIAVDAQALPPLAGVLNTASNKIDNVQATATAVKDSLIDARVDASNFAAATKQQILDNQQVLSAKLTLVGDDIVKRVLAAQTTVGGQINDKSAPLLRRLTQAKAVALDATPDQVYKGPGSGGKYKGWLKDDVALNQLEQSSAADLAVLANAPDLLARWQQAFARFTSNTLPDRGRRYAEMDRLAHDIVDYLK